MKSLWEKCDMFKVHRDFSDTPLRLPREGDRWLMDVIEEAGYSRADQDRLNRVRLHQQVVFLSDVLGTSGNLLDGRYLSARNRGEKWSSLDFPNECPP